MSTELAPTISAIGHYVPENVLKNSFFNELDIGSDEEFILNRTGISERRSVLTPEQIFALRKGDLDMVTLHRSGDFPSLAEIAKKAWDAIDHPVKSPDLVVCGTSCPDFEIPANACAISANLNLQVPSFDCNSACSSFIFNLHTVSSLLKTGKYQSIAVFNPERYSTRMDFSDKTSSILFGDGSTCSLLSKGGPGLVVHDTALHSDPGGYDAVKIPAHQTFWQNGRAVQKFAITKTVESSRDILEKNGLTTDDIHYFVGHQANLRMLISAAEKLGFDENQHLYNVDKFGNQGAAGAPSVLANNWEKFSPGERILVTAVGSGLSWGSAILEKKA